MFFDKLDRIWTEPHHTKRSVCVNGWTETIAKQHVLFTF